MQPSEQSFCRNVSYCKRPALSTPVFRISGVISIIVNYIFYLEFYYYYFNIFLILVCFSHRDSPAAEKDSRSAFSCQRERTGQKD